MAWMNNKPKVQRYKKLKAFKRSYDALMDYCNRSSLHGLSYIVDPRAHWTERLVWLSLFVLSLICTTAVIFKLAARFQAAQTSTVIETTNYKIYNLPFPSVTICPSNRVDWKRALMVEKNIVPADDFEAIVTYRRLLTKLSINDFGDFDAFSFLKNVSLKAFDGVNLTKLLRDVVPSCSDLFSNCWWRYSDRNCCEIFELQRTEFGFCYSFNSDTAEYDDARITDETRPRRSTNYGSWSGLRVNVHTNVTSPPDINQTPAIILSVDHPGVWPNNGKSIPAGRLATVSVRCVSSYATERVLELDESKRPCMYDPAKPYFQEYCLSECKRSYTVKYCDCSPSFLFPSGPDRECTVEDLICLSDANDVFNNYLEPKRNQNLSGEHRGMFCDCPTECEYYEYSADILETAQRYSRGYMNMMTLDVHFQRRTMLRYRMDIVYTSLDLLVSFGGVVGLFLGASVLSGAEILYHLIVGILRALFYRPRVTQKRMPTEKSTSHTTTVSGILPLLDYPGMKPKFTKNHERTQINTIA